MVDGYTSSERRANVRKQLRDSKGRWLEMGLKVRFLVNGKYLTGEVTDISPENDEVSVKTPDGTTHRRGSKELEGLGAKASLPGNNDAEGNRRQQEQPEDEQKQEPEPEPRSTVEPVEDDKDNLEDRILDLKLEEDVLREEGADKDEIREVQRERRELERQRSERDQDSEANGPAVGTDKSKDSSTDVPSDAPDNGDDSTTDKSAEETDGERDSSKERSNVPNKTDRSRSRPNVPNPNFPSGMPNRRNLPNAPNLDSIDIDYLDQLEDGDKVILVDPVNGTEDVLEFVRESGSWVGSNDFEDLELDTEELKDYVESRDPRDLLADRAGTEESPTTVRPEGDTPPQDSSLPVPEVGSTVSYTLGGASGVGRVVSTDPATGTVEISTGPDAANIELPTDVLGPAPAEDAVEGPLDRYVAPEVSFSTRFPAAEVASDAPLTTEERAAYNEGRARLSELLSGVHRTAAAQEIDDIDKTIEPLHVRAVAEFAKTFAEQLATPNDGDTAFADAGSGTASSPINPEMDAEAYQRVAERLYGPKESDISSINADLRAGYADEDVLELQNLVLGSEITDNTNLYRGEYVPLEVAEQITPGRALRSESFMAGMKSPEQLEKFLEKDADSLETSGKIPVEFLIQADAGAPGVEIAAPNGDGQDVLLPAGVELEVTDVSWNPETERLSVTASYDGTSVSSVDNLRQLEENPLKQEGTTQEEIQAALEQVNSEVNKHLLSIATSTLQGEEPSEEAVSDLARARAIRDSIAALSDGSAAPVDDTGVESDATSTEDVAVGSAVKKITDPAEAAALAGTIEGSDNASEFMRNALLAPGELEAANPTVYVSQAEDGTVQAAASVAEHTPEGSTSADYTRLDYLGAADGATGAQMFNDILEDAASKDQGVLLNPDQDSLDYWTGVQGLVFDPMQTGEVGYGLTPEMIKQRISAGHPKDSSLTAYGGDLSRHGVKAPASGETLTAPEQLADLPVGSSVRLETPDAEAEVFSKGTDGVWRTRAEDAQSPGATHEELIRRASAEGFSLTFEGPESVGDQVTSRDGTVSGTVSDVSPDGQTVQVQGVDGQRTSVPAAELQKTGTQPVTEPGSSDTRREDQRQRDARGEPFVSDGSGLALYVGSEASVGPEYKIYGNVVSIDEDGEHIVLQEEDGTTHRLPAEDVDLAVSVEVEVEE